VLYGPGPLREANFTAGMIVDAARGRLPGLPGGGGKRWCFTYIADAAEGIVAAWEHGVPGDRFVLAGENHTLREFFDAVAAAGGPKVARRSIPFWTLTAAGALGELVARLGGPRPKVTRGAVSIFRHDWAYDASRARERLRWKSRPLTEGVAETVRSLKDAGQL
jgi:nucleoside-diphosphate-sugar epimerase